MQEKGTPIIETRSAMCYTTYSKSEGHVREFPDADKACFGNDRLQLVIGKRGNSL